MHIVSVGLVVAGAVTFAVPPAVPAAESRTTSVEVRLTAADVPPGGLLTGFIGNQAVYCSLICPGLVRTGVTAVVTTASAPVVFVSALQAGDVLRAIGTAAASVTGPTNAAAAATILADGSLVAPRALNAFEVGVVGLLDVIPAAAGGVPGVVAGLQTARRDTYAALNAPIVANPAPLVNPRGPVEVTVVGAINVAAAVAFPAFNDVLGATTAVPDAVARELAATGDPVRAVSAGATRAAVAGQAAVSVVARAVRDAAVAHAASRSSRAVTPKPHNRRMDTEKNSRGGDSAKAPEQRKAPRHARSSDGSRHGARSQPSGGSPSL